MSNFSFGAPTSQPPAMPMAAPAFNFGAPKTTQAAIPLGFGTPATSMPAPTASVAPSFNFGGQPMTPSPFAAMGANQSAIAAPAPTMSLGGGGALNFPKPMGAATTTSASINFGTTTTSATGFSTGVGLFGKPTTAATTVAPTVPFVGLGGVSAMQSAAGGCKPDIKAKETQVPDEIAKTVDALKLHIKAQKSLSSDISRTSTSKLTYVSSEMLNLQWALQEIANSVTQNYNQIKLLRKETGKAIQSVEMAQRTQDTSVNLQYENLAPFQYFQNLVAKYEQDLLNLRQQIAATDRHMQSLNNPQSVAPEDLKRGFKQINESFISLAGRLHEIHQKVETQKEQFLNLRKYRLRNGTNVFAELDTPTPKVNTSRISVGPSPFSNITAMSSFGKSFGSMGGGTTSNTTNPSGI